MRRILFSLLFINLLCFHCYGEDYSDDGEYTITLSCINAPSYTIRIPETVDVSQENTIMYFYVKGDIYADQTLNVVFESPTALSNNGRIIPVTVSQNKNSWSYNELYDSYTGYSILISHQQLSAGTWSGYMNVAISLQGGS